MHQAFVRLAQGVGSLAILFYIISHFSCYFYNAHQVLVGLPQVVDSLAIYLDLI